MANSAKPRIFRPFGFLGGKYEIPSRFWYYLPLMNGLFWFIFLASILFSAFFIEDRAEKVATVFLGNTIAISVFAFVFARVMYVSKKIE